MAAFRIGMKAKNARKKLRCCPLVVGRDSSGCTAGAAFPHVLRTYVKTSAIAETDKSSVSFVLVAFLLMMEGTPDANAGSKLPDPIKAGVAEKLFRLDCGRSLANDESVWTRGENVGRTIKFSSTCQLIDGDVDVFGDGSVTLVSTPGHTPGGQRRSAGPRSA
jgi:hypothetical protein